MSTRLRKPPFWMISLVLIAATASLVPLAVAARARFNTSELTRIHPFQDMGTQPRFNAQQANPLFADGRAARPVIEGTVSRTAVLGDDHYTLGYTRAADGKVTFFDTFPGRLKVDDRFLQRGRERYNIYCASCHGVDGIGIGMVHIRASEIANAGGEAAWGTAWVAPANLHDDARRAREVGHLYNTINNGIRNMAGLGHQIPVDDRWAIVAYVRALQLSDNFPAAQLPADVRNNMKAPVPPAAK